MIKRVSFFSGQSIWENIGAIYVRPYKDTHWHMEDATAYGMFREKLIKIGSNGDKILVGHKSIYYGLTGGSMFHVARQALQF